MITTATETIYRFNIPRMIHETIDKETVVIDTETGVYYSITGSGYLLVQQLDQGVGVAELTARLAAAFGLVSASLRPQVQDFVDQLLVEELIVAAVDVADTSSELVLEGSEAYAPPVLEKFTDMHDLLLMDPIHEVSDAGWPHRD